MAGYNVSSLIPCFSKSCKERKNQLAAAEAYKIRTEADANAAAIRGSNTPVVKESTVSKVAGTVGQIAEAVGSVFGGTTVQQMPMPVQAPAKDNTMLFVILGIAALAVVFLLMRK